MKGAEILTKRAHELRLGSFRHLRLRDKPAGSLTQNIRILVAQTLAQWPYGRAHAAQAAEQRQVRAPSFDAVEAGRSDGAGRP
jgi:hypothetical protein